MLLYIRWSYIRTNKHSYQHTNKYALKWLSPVKSSLVPRIPNFLILGFTDLKPTKMHCPYLLSFPYILFSPQCNFNRLFIYTPSKQVLSRSPEISKMLNLIFGSVFIWFKLSEIHDINHSLSETFFSTGLPSHHPRWVSSYLIRCSYSSSIRFLHAGVFQDLMITHLFFLHLQFLLGISFNLNVLNTICSIKYWFYTYIHPLIHTYIHIFV